MADLGKSPLKSPFFADNLFNFEPIFMILTFFDSVFQDGFVGNHIDIFKKYIFLLALVVYCLQKRDAMHDFKNEKKC